jgi:hypothetical protein
MPHAKPVYVFRHVILFLALHASFEALLQGFVFTLWGWGGGGVAVATVVIVDGDQK